MRKLAPFEVYFFHVIFDIKGAHFIQACHHVIAQGVEVPRRHEVAKDPPEDANEATELGEELKSGVAGARVRHPIQVHLDCHLHPRVVYVLVRLVLHLFQREEILQTRRCPRVHREQLQVLRLQVRLRQLVWDNQAVLTAYWDVLDASLLDPRVLEEAIWVKANLSVEQDDVLVLEPFYRLLSREAKIVFRRVTEEEPYRDRLRLCRVVVAVDDEILLVRTHKLLLPQIDQIL